MNPKQGTPIFGRVAQLGERLVRNEEVVGSIPITSTISKPRLSVVFLFWGTIKNGRNAKALLLFCLEKI